MHNRWQSVNNLYDRELATINHSSLSSQSWQAHHKRRTSPPFRPTRSLYFEPPAGRGRKFFPRAETRMRPTATTSRALVRFDLNLGRDGGGERKKERETEVRLWYQRDREARAAITATVRAWRPLDPRSTGSTSSRRDLNRSYLDIRRSSGARARVSSLDGA